MIPHFGPAEIQQEQVVLTALARGACFDFAYTPSLHDVLRLRVGDRWYRFRFGDGGWARDESNGLTGWRAQMVTRHSGTLDRDP